MLFYPQRSSDGAENAIFLTAVEVEQDETTRCSLRSAAVCGQDRPGEQRLLAAAWMHLRDTPGIMVYLVQRWLPESVRQHIELDEDLLTQTACFLGLVHDLGKASTNFQGPIMAQLPEPRQCLEKYTTLSYREQNRQYSRHALASEAILRWLKCPNGLASVAGAQATNREGRI